jgi:hypothetical protein
MIGRDERKEPRMAAADQLVIEHVDPDRWETGERFGFPADGPRGRVYDEGDVSGNMTMVAEMPAGFVEPEHVHDDIDHWTVVLAGEMHVAGDVLRAGDCLYAPRGVRHGPLSYPVGCRVFTLVRGRSFDHEFEQG